MSKLVDYNSVEKEILVEIFNIVPFMDNWIANIVENYIYSTVRWYYPEEKIELEYRMRFDKKDGEYKRWFDNGKLSDIENYKEGMLDGEYKTWYSNDDQLYIQTSYTKGKIEGEYKSWYPNGQYQIQTNYVKGKIEGEYKEWFDNGSPSIQTSYVKGKIEGEYKEWYYIEGIGSNYLYRHFQTQYVNGKRNGKYIEWHTNGNKYIECFYSEDRKEGEYKEYTINGTKLVECFYSKGKLHGKYIEYEYEYFPEGKEKIDIEEYYYNGNKVPKEDLFTKYRELLDY